MKKENKKGFLSRLFDKLDKKLESKAKNSCCCCETETKDKSKKSCCK